MHLQGFMAVLASTVLVPMGTSQDRYVATASLTVATPTEMVSAGGVFDCKALTIQANGGNLIEAYAFGPANGIYALFAGFPVDMCQPLPGFTNNLAIWPIPVVFGVGALPATHPYHDPITCGNLVAARHTTGLPNWMVTGDTVRFQALAYEPNSATGMVFSRAVDVICR